MLDVGFGESRVPALATAALRATRGWLLGLAAAFAACQSAETTSGGHGAGGSAPGACSPDASPAYCDRFNAGDNLWQQYHRNWVESRCGGPAQNDGSKWYCTDAGTCTTYTCAM